MADEQQQQSDASVRENENEIPTDTEETLEDVETKSDLTVENIVSMKVDALKLELENRTLSKSGVKYELQNRLAMSMGLQLPNKTSTSPVNTLQNDFETDYEDFKKYVTREIFALKEGIEEIVFTHRQQEGENTENTNIQNETESPRSQKVTNIEESMLIKLQMQIENLKHENKYLKNDIHSKQTIIDILISNVNKEDQFLNVQQKWEKNEWQLPKKATRTRHQKTEHTEAPLNLTNRFDSLSHNNTNNYSFQSEYNTNQNKNKTYYQKNQIPNNRGDGNHYNKYPERDNLLSRKTLPKTSPGNSPYARMAHKGRKIIVFSDSHGSRIHKKEFSSLVTNGTANIKAFPGAKAAHLEHYVIPSLAEEKPDAVVIMVGANDISNNVNDKDIANTIMNVGRKCKQEGVNNVFICSLTCRANDMQRVSSINLYLKNMCRTENIFYINNDTIPSEYLHSDGIHLIYKGTVILANNILSSINGTYNNIY